MQARLVTSTHQGDQQGPAAATVHGQLPHHNQQRHQHQQRQEEDDPTSSCSKRLPMCRRQAQALRKEPCSNEVVSSGSCSNQVVSSNEVVSSWPVVQL
jgi:hypothetical protein